MPKKTKRQKRLADKHRLHSITPKQKLPPPSADVEHKTVEPASPLPEPKVDLPVSFALSPEEVLLRQVTVADLKKTASITVVLFALEFLVFYAKLMGKF